MNASNACIIIIIIPLLGLSLCYIHLVVVFISAECYQ